MAEFTIEIPEGFEPIHKDILKCFRSVNYQEYYLKNGKVKKWLYLDSATETYLILKKIEKPKEYRPCENVAEAERLWDKKIKFKGSGEDSIFRLNGIGSLGVFIGASYYSHREAFEQLECVDGTPFGVEVL